MYDINRVINEKYVSSYIYRTKNSSHQILYLEAFLTTRGFVNILFYITTKRKSGFQYLKQTGKDGLSSLVWAKNAIQDFLNNPPRELRGKELRIYGDDRRRFSVYQRSLTPLGFKVSRTQAKYLYKRI